MLKLIVRELLRFVVLLAIFVVFLMLIAGACTYPRVAAIVATLACILVVGSFFAEPAGRQSSRKATQSRSAKTTQASTYAQFGMSEPTLLFLICFHDAWCDRMSRWTNGGPESAEHIISEEFKRGWTAQMIGHAASWTAGAPELPVLVDSLARFARHDGEGFDWSRIRRDENHLDLTLAGGKTLPELRGGRPNWRYPMRLDVIVQHELGEDIEQEMWKLLFWRASLKVIVAYDHWTEPGAPGWTSKWLEDKVELLRAMRRQAEDDEGAAGKGTLGSIVLLVGRRRPASSGFESWRAVSISQGRAQPIDVWHCAAPA